MVTKFSKKGKFTQEEKEKIKRVLDARAKLHKAGENLKLQRYRRQQAEKGNVLAALFGKPPIRKRMRRKR